MKKPAIVLTILALMSGLFSACTPGGTNPSAAGPTRTVVDMVGREVVIPATVNTFVPLANTPRMITYLGLANHAVGISGFDADTVSPLQAYAYASKDVWAGLPIVGTDSFGSTAYYPEEIIRVAPDAILCSYEAELADEIQSKTGIPVLAVPMGTLFGDDYDSALRFLADVCGVPERAERVIAFIDDCLADLRARTVDMQQSQKPSVLGAAATFKGMHGIDGVYVNYAVFKAIAANDVTEGISPTAGGVLVDKEQILVWNPEYIFLDSGGVGLVRTDYAENPGFYAQLSAVQKGNIYQYPSSTSYYSNVEIPIVNSYYVASIIYPEQFKDIVFEDKASEIFGLFLNDPDYLEKINASGLGYGKVTLGG